MLSPVSGASSVWRLLPPDAGVCRNLVSGLDQQDVAGNDVVGCDALALAVAHDRGFGAASAIRARTDFPPAILHEAEQGVSTTMARMTMAS